MRSLRPTNWLSWALAIELLWLAIPSIDGVFTPWFQAAAWTGPVALWVPYRLANSKWYVGAAALALATSALWLQFTMSVFPSGSCATRLFAWADRNTLLLWANAALLAIALIGTVMRAVARSVNKVGTEVDVEQRL